MPFQAPCVGETLALQTAHHSAEPHQAEPRLFQGAGQLLNSAYSNDGSGRIYDRFAPRELALKVYLIHGVVWTYGRVRSKLPLATGVLRAYYIVAMILVPQYDTVWSAPELVPIPTPPPLPTSTTRNVRFSSIPGKLPSRAPMVSVRAASFQCIGIVAWTPFS